MTVYIGTKRAMPDVNVELRQAELLAQTTQAIAWGAAILGIPIRDMPLVTNTGFRPASSVVRVSGL
jgi:hypothetical protein